MRGGHEEVLDEVVLAQLSTADTLAAATLRAVEVGLGALGVTATRDRDDDVLLGDEVLHGHLALGRDDLRPPLVAELVDQGGELVGDDLPLALLAREDRLELGDLRLDLSEGVDDALALERSQPAKLHVEDRRRLDLVDVEQRDQGPKKPAPPNTP